MIFKNALHTILRKFLFDKPRFDENKTFFAEQRLIEHSKKISETANDFSLTTWESFITQISERVLSEPIENLLTWPEIKGSMFVSNAKYVRKELKSLRSKDNWNSLKSVCAEIDVGSPRVFGFYPRASGNLIHHAYLASLLEDLLSIKIKGLDFVFEFGGGYGNMAKVFHKMGFLGTYHIFDFEIFSLIQTWYLTKCGLNINGADSINDNKAPNIQCLNSPNEVINNPSNSDWPESLFIGTWSFSETPINYRKLFEGPISNFHYVFITFQNNIEDIDNVEYFNTLSKSLTTHTVNIEPLPYQKNNFVFTARKKIDTLANAK